MTQTVEEKIQILESLDALLDQKFNGEYEKGEMVRLRKDINAIVPTTRRFDVAPAKITRKL